MGAGGEKGEAGEQDPCLRQHHPAQPPVRKPLFQVDRDNLCIFIALLLLLIGIIGALSFALGQWTSGLGHSSLSNLVILSEEQSSSPSLLFQSWETEREGKLRMKEEEREIERLPGDVVPVHYDLELNFTRVVKSKSVTGRVKILLRVKNQTRRIKLHGSPALKITQIELFKAGETIRWLSLERRPRSSMLMISTGELLEEGQRYHLALNFTTTICDSTKSKVYCYNPPGFRTSRNSREADGGRALIFSTKFEPDGARTFMPCFDEPAYKVPFRTSIVHLVDDTVLTNAQVEQKEWVEEGAIRTGFRDTPPMSTYLLAFVFGTASSLVSLERKSQRGVIIRMWAQEQDIFKAEFALDRAVYMFDVIEKYFIVKYPLKKLDLIAAHNYPVGAMENYGLIIFHYKMILRSEDNFQEGSGEGDERYEREKSREEEFKVTKIIIHELLHQWFGNLVTMDWWSDIWLNEGFSTFYNYHFASNSFPRLTEWEYYELMRETMNIQSRESERHALIRDFPTSESINRGFSLHHLYTKGAIVSRMLFDLLGENILRGGLIRYLQDRSFSSATTDQLWSFLGNIRQIGTGRTSISRVMSDWVNNAGFPLVEVHRREKALHFTQTTSDFSAHTSYRPVSIYGVLSITNETWKIPIVYVWQGNLEEPAQSFWLENQTQSILEDESNSRHVGEWLLLNPGFQFPFRVSYDAQNWNLLIHQLHRDHLIIPRKSRLQLISDSDLSLKWSQNFILHFRLLRYLRKEEDVLPLKTGLKVLFSLLQDFKASKAFPLLLIYYRDVIENVISLRDSGSWKENWIRHEVQSLICAIYHPSCHVNPTRVIHYLSSHNSSLQGDEEWSPICHYLYGNASSSEVFLIAEGLRSPHNAKQHLVKMATCTRDPDLYRKAADYLINSGNAGYIITALTKSPLMYNEHFRSILWDRVSNLEEAQLSRLFKRENLARRCLETAMTLQELDKLASIIPGQKELKEQIRLKLQWIEVSASPLLEQWLFREIRPEQLKGLSRATSRNEEQSSTTNATNLT